jgi:hypothetical protein
MVGVVEVLMLQWFSPSSLGMIIASGGGGGGIIRRLLLNGHSREFDIQRRTW